MSELPQSYINLIALNGPGVYYSELGGYFAGVIDTRATDPNGLRYLLFVSPKKVGEFKMSWKKYYTNIMSSEWNGKLNTETLLDLNIITKFWHNANINNYFDWYLPSKQELLLLYSVFNPRKTKDNNFKLNKNEVFKSSPYWSSTNHNSVINNVFTVNFFTGNQQYSITKFNFYIRLVRQVIF